MYGNISYESAPFCLLNSKKKHKCLWDRRRALDVSNTAPTSSNDIVLPVGACQARGKPVSAISLDAQGICQRFPNFVSVIFLQRS